MQPNSPSLDRLSDEEQEDWPLTGRRQARKNTSWYRVVVVVMIVSIFFSILAFFTLTQTQSPAWDFQHRLACSVHKEDCETTAPFIFDTVYSLLKQWPNTYGPNGHSIVAATVPINTQLYHARPDGKPPKVPTFFAFDAYVCEITTCKHLTFPATDISQRDVPRNIWWFWNTDDIHHDDDETIESSLL
jgi:hypothetical protein